jgi:hypothetical protein
MKHSVSALSVKSVVKTRQIGLTAEYADHAEGGVGIDPINPFGESI